MNRRSTVDRNYRRIRGTLVGAKGMRLLVRLDMDDKFASSSPQNKGDLLWIMNIFVQEIE